MQLHDQLSFYADSHFQAGSALLHAEMAAKHCQVLTKPQRIFFPPQRWDDHLGMSACSGKRQQFCGSS